VAVKKAELIANFPFVRAVMVSGSLSKGYMDENSDLDFFIVTAPNRLWVARTLLVLYKRIFLRNSHKHFCVNYFVDARHLEIEEKNLFTATELVTLIPLQNQKCYQALLSANQWYNRFFPNFKPAKGDLSDQGHHVPQKFLEALLSPVATGLDKFFMRITLDRWNRFYGKEFARADFDIAFKSRRHVSKSHPNHYQKKILELYQRKLIEYKNRIEQLTAYE